MLLGLFGVHVCAKYKFTVSGRRDWVSRGVASVIFAWPHPIAAPQSWLAFLQFLSVFVPLTAFVEAVLPKVQ